MCAIDDEAFPSFNKLDFISQVGEVLVHVDLFGTYGVACLLEGPVKLDFFAERASIAPQLPRPAVKLLVEKTPLTFGIRPHALTVMVPQDFAG